MLTAEQPSIGSDAESLDVLAQQDYRLLPDVRLLHRQRVVLLRAVRADRKGLVVLRRHEEHSADSPNGFPRYRAPGEMPAVRVMAVPTGLGFGKFTLGNKGFQCHDAFGPRARLTDVRVGATIAIPALLGRAQGDESADCQLPREVAARMRRDQYDLRLNLVSIVSVFADCGNDESDLS